MINQDLNAHEYQKIQGATTLKQCNTREYMAIGLANEMGEALGLIKKQLRGDKEMIEDPVAFAESLEAELGDVVWYLVGLCNVYGISFQDVLDGNANKVESRHERGVVQGNGDKR